MSNATFDRPDLSAFTGLDDLGLEVMGQRVGDDRTVLACKVVGEDRWCRQCGGEGVVRDTVVRRLAHVPYGWHPTMLHVSVRRYRCPECAHVWRQNMSAAADPRAKLSRAAVRWALVGLVVHHLTVARVADVLAVSWNTANTAILGEGQRMLIDDPDRFEGVRVIGVDEHVWRHTPYGDKYVTVILDLTPIRDRRGPSRLLDMIPGRSKRVFKTWLASQPDTWRERIEIVAMDGFTGFKSAAAEELPDARAVMDPFHVVRLAGDALDECRRRIQQELHHRRGRATDPLYKARRMLHTRSCLLTPRQQHQLADLFASDCHVALEVTWSVYQNITRCLPRARHECGQGPDAGRNQHADLHARTEEPDRAHHAGQDTQTPSRGHPWPTSTTPTPQAVPPKPSTDASNTYADPHSDLRNLTNYITRALLETGGFKPQRHPQL